MSQNQIDVQDLIEPLVILKTSENVRKGLIRQLDERNIFKHEIFTNKKRFMFARDLEQ